MLRYSKRDIEKKRKAEINREIEIDEVSVSVGARKGG